VLVDPEWSWGLLVKRGTSVRAAALLAAGAVVLAGCQGGGDGAKAGGTKVQGAAASASAPATPAASIAVVPANGTAKVRPDSHVDIKVTNGTLRDVAVTPKGGSPLPGAIAAGGAGWTTNARLKPGTTYQVTASATSADGKPVTSTSTFTTLTPKRTVTASVVPGDGWTVGIGMPVVVDFSRPVKNRAAALKGLTVTSTPQVEGAWRWFSSSQVQWRPKNYWTKGTKVTVTSDLAGVEVSPGVWGKSKRSSSFGIGSAMISTVDMKAHRMTVRRDGKVIRTIPITTGKSGYQTRKGVKVIMSRESSRRMDSETTGISKDNPEYYNIDVKYAMRLTHSGEFLHAAPWSVGSQGHANVSHGCTGMSTANAKWLFGASKVGDVVVYTGSSRELEWGNGYTAWDMPFSRWAAA
jgi:lipoprotein-anchoring transpeptidase ErfK/SrfK